MIKISTYLDAKRVLFLHVKTRDEALHALVDAIDATGLLQDKESFYGAVINREKLVTTGIGMGVAIPHAKLPGYDDFFVTIGILPEGIDWGALDSVPVRLIFLIGGPDDKQTEYLQILSSLTAALKDEERRKKMLTINDPDAMIRLFR